MRSSKKSARIATSSFTKGSQSRLCLACHKDINKDRELGKGLHGKRPDAVKPNCNVCHTDHKGRTADVVQFDKETFNHALTNFPLIGGHKEPACDGCHKPNVKFRNAPNQCIGCHKSTDKHKGRLGENCQSCHSEESWAKVRTFDHSKTKFPLTGGHEKVTCAACHPNEKYKGVPLACSSCHQLQDVHQGKYGAKCESLPREYQVEDPPFQSLEDQIPAPRRPCAPALRGLPHGRPLQGQARDNLHLLPQEGRSA